MKLSENQLNQSLKYLRCFLLKNNKHFEEHVIYTDEQTAKNECRSKKRNIYIIKSGFFEEKNYGEKTSLPIEPLPEYKGAKFFYGKSKEEIINGNYILYADIIASSYFVVTRYEEFIRSNVRDQHGNFPAKKSILYRENILFVPVVDMYGEILCELLLKLGYDVYLKQNGFENLYFTHDIDIPFGKYTFIQMAKTIGKKLLEEHQLIISPLLNFLGIYRINPYRTWDYMLSEENRIADELGISTKSICFIIAAETSDRYTLAYIYDKKTKGILEEMKKLNAVIGLHTSYDAAEDKEKLFREKYVLEKILGEQVKYQRNHYLRQVHPSDILQYESAGFTDDFTTGFNGMPGFRLGTCHSIKWINPADGCLSNITLHGLQIMDGSLRGKKPYQMELNEEEAVEICKNMIDKVYHYCGEICILWHNGTFDKNKKNYMKRLYDWILGYIELLVKSV